MLWTACQEDSRDPCSAEGSEEMEILCRVQESARRASAGQESEATQQCEAIPSKLWKEECFFRAGESLASERPLSSLALCSRAGQFQKNCITHSVWSFPSLTQHAGPEAAEELEAWEHQLRQRVPALEDQELAEIRAALWWRHFNGSGAASASWAWPALARPCLCWTSSPSAPASRSAGSTGSGPPSPPTA